MLVVGGWGDRQDAADRLGAWLLRQDKRIGWVGDLAKAAKADRGFPRQGSPDEVRARMRELQADGDAWAAIDDAEDDWLWL